MTALIAVSEPCPCQCHNGVKLVSHTWMEPQSGRMMHGPCPECHDSGTRMVVTDQPAPELGRKWVYVDEIKQVLRLAAPVGEPGDDRSYYANGALDLRNTALAALNCLAKGNPE